MSTMRHSSVTVEQRKAGAGTHPSYLKCGPLEAATRFSQTTEQRVGEKMMASVEALHVWGAIGRDGERR